MLFTKPLNSRMEAVVFSFQGQSIPLLVQRDDLMHPLISGNKYRKMQAFVQKDAKGYVSFGGAWSNNLLAVAALARMQGVPAVGYIRGDEVRPINPYERWLMQLGMELLPVSRKEYGNKMELYATAASRFPTYVCIPEGGHPQPNGLAFDRWVQEIPEQTGHVLVSCGTGATLLGLASAMQKAGRKSKLWGISAVNAPKFIEQLRLEATRLYPHVQICGSLEGQRFGKSTQPERIIAKAFFKQTGIAPDPVYDSRVLAVMVDCFEKGLFTATDSLLWLHSGGLTGWAGYPSECKELFGL